MMLALGACLAWVAILWLSDRSPARGLWPPVRGSVGTAVWAWGLTLLIYVGLFRDWGQDWNALGWSAGIRWGLGVGLGLVGTLLQTWGMADLGLKGTSGWNVGVVTRGSYAFCRHPQYLGQALGFAGLFALAANPVSLAIGLAATATLLYCALVEDRALASRHPDFRAYSRSTPFLFPTRIAPQ